MLLLAAKCVSKPIIGLKSNLKNIHSGTFVVVQVEYPLYFLACVCLNWKPLAIEGFRCGQGLCITNALFYVYIWWKQDTLHHIKYEILCYFSLTPKNKFQGYFNITKMNCINENTFHMLSASGDYLFWNLYINGFYKCHNRTLLYQFVAT